MNDDSIREVHGCKAGGSRVLMRENGGDITMEISGSTAVLTMWQARYIASKLYLIAAAPELFEAGDDLVDFIDAHVPLLRDNPLTDALRAALAKARGETQ